MKKDAEELRRFRDSIRTEEGTKAREKLTTSKEERGNERLLKISEEMEKEKNKLNVVISGLRGEWNKEKIERWINNKLKINAIVVDMWHVRIRKERIVARCKDLENKEKMMKNKKLLGKEQVFIDNDLTFNERRMRERVVNIARRLKKEGLKVKAGFNKVYGENCDWIWSVRENKWFRKEKSREEETKNMLLECSGDKEK